MTNEQYLIVSYFSAAGGGIVLAALTAWLLRGPAVRAVGVLLGPLAAIIRRLLPAWLVAAVIAAVTMVSYFDCNHGTYQSVVDDRQHLVDTTFHQAQFMMTALCIALLAYGLALAVALIIAPANRPGETNQPRS